MKIKPNVGDKLTLKVGETIQIKRSTNYVPYRIKRKLFTYDYQQMVKVPIKDQRDDGSNGHIVDNVYIFMMVHVSNNQ